LDVWRRRNKKAWRGLQGVNSTIKRKTNNQKPRIKVQVRFIPDIPGQKRKSTLSVLAICDLDLNRGISIVTHSFEIGK